MIFAYKIMTGKMNMEANKIFNMSNKMLRGHKYKLRMTKMNKTMSKNRFSNRIIKKTGNCLSMSENARYYTLENASIAEDTRCREKHECEQQDRHI